AGRFWQEPGIADRSGQRPGILVLRLAVRSLRARVLLPPRAWYGRVLGHAGRRSRDLLVFLLHRNFLPLVQRDRLPGGDWHGGGGDRGAAWAGPGSGTVSGSALSRQRTHAGLAKRDCRKVSVKPSAWTCYERYGTHCRRAAAAFSER